MANQKTSKQRVAEAEAAYNEYNRNYQIIKDKMLQAFNSAKGKIINKKIDQVRNKIKSI
jgi:hypothetical protein